MTTVALLGNPNTGKSTFFNRLTNQYANVGNWAGVTVDQTLGNIPKSNINIIDLPGICSLTPITKDEAVTVDYLLENNPTDAILNIANVCQLKRNLLLSIELLELGKPLILVLNMMDELSQSGVHYDLDILSQHLGCPIRATAARQNSGVDEVRACLSDQTTVTASDPLELDYPKAISADIRDATTQLVKKHRLSQNFARWLTIQFMSDNDAVVKYVDEHRLDTLSEGRQTYREHHYADQIFHVRLTFIEDTLAAATNFTENHPQNTVTAKIDCWVTHPILGLPIFVGIFWFMFKLSFDWIGTPLSDYLNALLSGPLSEAANHWLTVVGALLFLRSLIVDGIIAGVGGVLTFIPQIFVLFACITVLEDSGYMSRAALVTDRLMQLIGLNGQAFIPLIIGFGCNVTGIIATRTIEQPRERLVTTLIAPFMSCSARLPIYSLFVTAFFNQHQAVIVLSLYFLGIVIALAMAKFYQLVFKLKDASNFVVTLPNYHRPRLDLVIAGAWEKGKAFVKKTGTVIFAGTILVWLLSNIGPHGYVINIDASFLAIIGRWLQPAFAPLGITNWQTISALMTGVLAKEVISSSMIVLFHLSGQTSLVTTFSTLFTPLSAYSLLVFILIYAPCFATLGAIKTETGSVKWAIYSLISSTVLAYGLALIIFQVGSLF
ncbi:ferrous iron transport protein B [Furfurilactobacillus milii]|uniref:Ferrous iron transport protein B n=1 Tax=Furfurilactobacillus rossiae TaxID=231049 RepID=A0A7C9J2F0_9LACO|nr:ferrous iron transport protein B [Furfurilactobacillus milii]MYV05898.1 ferrous iron transport protein B [Furfurilactobacillus milii]